MPDDVRAVSKPAGHFLSKRIYASVSHFAYGDIPNRYARKPPNSTGASTAIGVPDRYSVAVSTPPDDVHTIAISLIVTRQDFVMVLEDTSLVASMPYTVVVGRCRYFLNAEEQYPDK